MTALTFGAMTASAVLLSVERPESLTHAAPLTALSLLMVILEQIFVERIVSFSHTSFYLRKT